jgi:hypothetical protein
MKRAASLKLPASKPIVTEQGNEAATADTLMTAASVVPTMN